MFVQPEQHRAAKARRGRHDGPRDRRQAGRGGAAVAVRVLVPRRARRTDAGDYERAYEIAAEGLEHYPDNPSLHYNLACYAALAGRREDALRAHRDRASSGSPETREWAAGDSDLDSIR